MNRRSLCTTLLAAGAAVALPCLTLAASGGVAAGIAWTLPARRTAGASRPMRVATYQIPAAKGAEAGECGVFFFGYGQGGSVDENIARWGQQFEGGARSVSKAETIAGMRVHRVSASGTYLAPVGPMMQSQGKKPGWRLAGAIVEAPDGPVFFKCVGPDATIVAAAADLDALLRSIRKVPAHNF